MPGLFHGTSLEQPVTCEHCGQPRDACTCPKDAAGDPRPPATQHPRVRREKRRGSWNTIIADIHTSPGELRGPDPAKPGDLAPLLKALKARLGTGGGLATPPANPRSDRHPAPEILLQGDHRDAVVDHLNQLGYHAKPAGG